MRPEVPVSAARKRASGRISARFERTLNDGTDEKQDDTDIKSFISGIKRTYRCNQLKFTISAQIRLTQA